ncbi:hypothetical protein GGI07_001258 [Coemansia sp. Benny D115]|nr:hypothetical protein GGI07_001258 [Coemansia sp. Benny D115]
MKLLREELASALNESLPEATTISLRNKGITHIEGLGSCTKLWKLDLSENKLSSSDSLPGVSGAGSLKHINLSSNEFTNMDIIKGMTKAHVFNISGNQLKKISPCIVNCSDLKALILGKNAISKIEHVDGLVNLNTLVVSHNKIKQIPDMPQLRELTKISAAHNNIEKMPNLEIYPKLKEVKLNDNKIKVIPESFRKSSSSMTIVDLGNNQLDTWESIAPLSSMSRLFNLTLKGNPICNKKRYREKVIEMIPSLRNLDGERFDQWYLDRKEKRRQKDAQADAEEEDDADDNDESEGASKEAKRARVDGGARDGREGKFRREPSGGSESRRGSSRDGGSVRGRGRGMGFERIRDGRGFNTRGGGSDSSSDRGRSRGRGGNGQRQPRHPLHGEQ